MKDIIEDLAIKIAIKKIKELDKEFVKEMEEVGIGKVSCCGLAKKTTPFIGNKIFDIFPPGILNATINLKK